MASYSVTPQNQADIAGLYAAFWNRAPDTSGFAFWVEKLASGQASLAEIATEMRFKPEGTAEYPLWSTNSALIVEVYNNIFGRSPDPGGFEYWLDLLDGGLPFPELVVAICDAAITNRSSDGALFLNKIAVGIYAATVAQVNGGYVCDQAFNLVTADPGSVDTAINWIDANNTGVAYTLTTNIDTINIAGHQVNTITGLQDGSLSETWNTGDSINGNGQTRVNLIANGGAASIVDANNVASINVNLIAHTTLDELEFTDVNQVLVTSGVVLSEGARNLTVVNASQTTVHGFAKAGRAFIETINYANTTGTSDVAALMVAGTGTSTDNSRFNVANGDTIEAVSLATSGTNYVTLNAGTGAAKFTISGSGSNDILFGSAAATKLIDASTTIGINILNLGTQLNSGDTIIGGAAAADTLVAELTSGTQLLPTISGVETLNLEFNAAAILNASKITGATHLNIAGSSANATVTNLANTASTLGTTVSNAGTVSVSYVRGAATEVTYNLGGDVAVENAATTFANIGSLTVNAGGDSTSATGDLALGDTARALLLTSASADNGLTVGEITGMGLQTLSIKADGGDVLLGSVNSKTDGSELRALTVVSTGGADVTIGDINANNATASTFSSFSVEMGDDATLSIGDIEGLFGKNTIDTYDIALGDNIGNSSVGIVTADTIGSVNVQVGANDSGFISMLSITALAANHIGDINLMVGKDSKISAFAAGNGVERHSIGDITGSGAGDIDFAVYDGNLDAIGTIDMTSLSGDSKVEISSWTVGVVMLGGSGADEFWGGVAADVIAGNDGNDYLLGEDGADDIDGGAGNDIINGGRGPDVIDGGLGNNTATYEASMDEVVVNLQTNINTGGYAEGDSLFNIQNIRGSVFSDSLTGDEAANIINGRHGNDTINGGADADIIDGGYDNNTASYSGSSAVVVNLATNVNAGGYAQGDVLSNIQNLIGSTYADNLTGDSGANVLNGNSGNDTLTGGLGDDDFIMSAIVNSADSLGTYTVTDFNVTADQIGNFSIANLQAQHWVGEIVQWQNADNQGAGNVVTATISGATDLASIASGTNVLVLNGNFANASAVLTALASGGSYQLTVNNDWAINSAAIVVWDDGSNTYISQFLTHDQGVADNGQFVNNGNLILNQMAILSGVADATTVTNSNYLAFLA